jgi:hypothetical protein
MIIIYTTHNMITIYTARNIYSTVEYRELFFHTLKNIIQRNKFSRVCSYFALHKKSKNYGTRSLKNVIFQKLRFALILRDFSNYFSSFIHTGWHRQYKL